MKLVIQLLGILFILAGISLLIDPEFIYGWIENNLENKSVYISAIVGRLVIGTLLIIAAKESRYPRVIKFIGYFVIIAAIIFIFIGHENFKDFLSSLIPAFKPYAPVGGLFSLALGSFLIYAFSERKDLKNENKGKFRFTYFTDKYVETSNFYQNKLAFSLEHSWDRSEIDKGALFKAGEGLIEILHRPNDEENKNQGLDYRIPQGVYMCIQVWNIDELFKKYKAEGIPFKQEVVNQPWGHRSFSVVEPNNLVLFFFQEQF